MVKKYCDSCKEEVVDKDFSCEIQMREIKQTSLVATGSHEIKPQLIEKYLHVCKKCYETKVKL